MCFVSRFKYVSCGFDQLKRLNSRVDTHLCRLREIYSGPACFGHMLIIAVGIAWPNYNFLLYLNCLCTHAVSRT